MEGAQVIGSEAESAPPVPMLGHVTSSYFSPNLGRSIAMAMVKGGRKPHGRAALGVAPRRRADPGHGRPAPISSPTRAKANG